MTHLGTRPGTILAETRHLRLRTKRLSDAPNDYLWRRDPEIARFDAATPTTIPYSQFLGQAERDLSLVNPTRCVVAIDTLDGKHIGNVMYYNADSTARVAEFGICIGSREHRGLGLGTEATIAFLDYVWRAVSFNAMHLHTLEWNTRARRSFRRAGFAEVARVRRGGNWFVRMEAQLPVWGAAPRPGR